jgi:hypothetical protein
MPRKTARQPRPTAAAINTDAVTPAPEQIAGPAPAREKKIDKVIALLGGDRGATLAELVEATGWLPHTTRAALTGLRKKGHVLEKSKRDDATCYRIVEAG